jgi:serine/threonine-protein kinase
VSIEHEATRRARVPGSEGRVGEVLNGKYRLEELLGAGAMGTVYRAVNQLVGRTVAIKLLKAEHAENPVFVERFMREARAANLVRHRNVVDVIDIDKDLDGHPFIVQELLSGEDLSRYVARRGGRLPLEEVVDLMCPVIEAVAEAHAKGVVHRDLKPENVFLAKEGKETVPKLLDFGISKVRAPDLRATEVGLTMGTPAYMSPEQVQGARDADPRSDVWALGIMLFELLSGRLPFDADDAPALFVAIATKEPPALLDIDKRMPPNVSKVVSRCLRRLPQDRYPTASELARDLRLVMIGQELEPTGKLSVPPSLRVPDLAPPAVRVPPAAKTPEEVKAVVRTSPSMKPVDDHGPTHFSRRKVIEEPASERDPSLASDTAPSAGTRKAAPPEPPPPPSLDVPELVVPTKPPKPPPPKAEAAPPPPRQPPPPKPKPAPSASPELAAKPSTHSQPAGRLAAEAALPGVVMAPGTGRSAKPPARREDWGLARERRNDGPDMSLVVGIAVVGVILIGIVGALMQIAHRPEGWAIGKFLLGSASTTVTVFQIGLGIAVGAVGVTYSRRGVRQWRGDIGGGPPGAIISALIAAGTFFAAVELFSAAG